MIRYYDKIGKLNDMIRLHHAMLSNRCLLQDREDIYSKMRILRFGVPSKQPNSCQRSAETWCLILGTLFREQCVEATSSDLIDLYFG